MKSYKYIGAATLILFLIQCTNETKFEKLFPYQEKEDSYWGYIDFNGKKKIDPVFKDLPGLFYEGYALMNTSDGSYDYINKDGREHERNYVDASDFSEGIAFGVNRDEYPILLNAQLEEVKVLEKVDELYSSSEGLICFKNTKGKWGYMNQEGEIAFEHKSIRFYIKPVQQTQYFLIAFLHPVPGSFGSGIRKRRGIERFNI